MQGGRQSVLWDSHSWLSCSIQAPENRTARSGGPTDYDLIRMPWWGDDERLGKVEEAPADGLAAKGAVSSSSMDRNRPGPVRLAHERQRIGAGLPQGVDAVTGARAAS